MTPADSADDPALRGRATRTRSGWWDVSPTVSERLAVFPGDQPYGRGVALDFARGDNLRLSAITTTLHVGAHADAPSHYHVDGVAIDACDVERYVGLCQVMTVHVASGARIQVADLPAAVAAPRLLLHTATFPNPEQWQGDFASLAPQLVDFLGAAGVTLIGIDTPSVDPADDAVLHAHRQVYAGSIALLEGLVLAGVPDGLYTLVAVPLRLAGADASPVRALLLPLDTRELNTLGAAPPVGRE